MVSDTAWADAVLWGPGGDVHSLPAGPAWHTLWLPSLGTSDSAAGAVMSAQPVNSACVSV